MISILNATKGHKSVINLGGVMVLFLCISSHMFYIVPIFTKMSQRISDLWSGNNFHSKIYKGV